jgi:hypothetical protein
MAAHLPFGVPPGFFAQGPPPGYYPGGGPEEEGPPPGFAPTRAPLSNKEIVQRLLAQHSPSELIEQFCGAPPIQRNINVLYILYREWMSKNQHQVVQQMADGCLLGHFSDRLLLQGGWEDNRECLAILWREQVHFKGNWEGDESKVLEFWEPYVTPAPEAPAAPEAPVAELEHLSMSAPEGPD